MGTIDELVSKRHKVVINLCDNLSVEVDGFLRGKVWQDLLAEVGDTEGVVEACVKKFM